MALVLFLLVAFMSSSVLAIPLSPANNCEGGDRPTRALVIIYPNRPTKCAPPNAPPPRLVYGTVHIVQETSDGPAFYNVSLSGLPPCTQHGFHVHEHGDIFTDGCQSAGGHYNPFSQTHGGRNATTRHVGDLGNVMSDQCGNVNVGFSDNLAKLRGCRSVIGRSLVVHALEDDLGEGGNAESKITGNAGKRVACGVIVNVTP